MSFNPFLAQRLAERKIDDALREAAQERLARRVVDGHRPSAVGWALFALGCMGVIAAIWR